MSDSCDLLWEAVDGICHERGGPACQPLARAADDICGRPSDGWVFRGAMLRDFNQAEFRDGTVPGSTITMHTVDDAELDNWLDRENMLRSQINSLRQIKQNVGVETIERDVVGGFGTELVSSWRFAASTPRSATETPLVLFMRRQDIPERLIDVEYTQEFKANNPAIAGKVDRGSEMLVETNFDRATNFANVDGNRVFFRENPVRSFTGMSEEAEAVCLCESVDISQSVAHAVTYLTESGVRAIGDGSLDAAHDAIRAEMGMFADRLVVIQTVVSPSTVGGGNMDAGKFQALYDGDTRTESISDARQFFEP